MAVSRHWRAHDPDEAEVSREQQPMKSTILGKRELSSFESCGQTFVINGLHLNN